MNSLAADTIKVRADFDRSVVQEKGNSVRYLGITVLAPLDTIHDAAKQPRHERPPLNLALVIDASGSMGGGRLDAAKRAASGLIGQLSARDVLSVVSFASDVFTHLDPAALNDDNKRSALLAIDGLQTRGSTNLSGGWLQGAGCVASYLQTHPNCHNHVLLLTDGHANEGIINPQELGRQAEQLLGRSISTSAVGIGDGYSSDQIATIATNGGGQLHHANTPEHIIEVVQGELSDLAGTVADNVTIEVGYAAGVKVEAVGDFPITQQAQQIRCKIGSVIAGRPRLAIFKVTALAGGVGQQLPFHPRVQWNLVGTAEVQTAEAPPALLRVASEADNNAQPRKMDLSMEVAKVWQGATLQRAVQLNREGLYQQAQQLLQTELCAFEPYCQGLPGTEPLVQEMKDALRDISGAWDEGRRKEAEVRAYKASRQQTDHRSKP